MDLEIVQVVRILGTAFCVLGIILCWRLRNLRFGRINQSKTIALGVATLSLAVFWKLAAMAAFVVVPVGAAGVANYHTFRGVHEVQACNRCHVMTPMVHDMHDPESNLLAARHYKNHLIPKDQCYNCHSDYGLSGDLAAKLEGFRHLARYTTRTYQEPIAARTKFNNDNCLKCHDGAPKFKAVASHQAVGTLLGASAMSCTNCHGPAHPTREARTPGSPDYDRLMEKTK